MIWVIAQCITSLIRIGCRQRSPIVSLMGSSRFEREIQCSRNKWLAAFFIFVAAISFWITAATLPGWIYQMHREQAGIRTMAQVIGMERWSRGPRYRVNVTYEYVVNGHTYTGEVPSLPGGIEKHNGLPIRYVQESPGDSQVVGLEPPTFLPIVPMVLFVLCGIMARGALITSWELQNYTEPSFDDEDEDESSEASAPVIASTFVMPVSFEPAAARSGRDR